MFITFEGIDGCGKTTQIEMLKGYLESRGYKVFVTKEPGGSDLGEFIEKIFKSKSFSISSMCELLLMYADRLYHIENIILPYIEKGYIVISDRFQDSTVAYQGYGGNIELEVVQNVARECGITLEPDVTFYIDIPVDVALSRVGLGDRMESKGVEFFNKVRRGYLKISEGEPERVFKIDGNREKGEVHRTIVEILEKRLLV